MNFWKNWEIWTVAKTYSYVRYEFRSLDFYQPIILNRTSFSDILSIFVEIVASMRVKIYHTKFNFRSTGEKEFKRTAIIDAKLIVLRVGRSLMRTACNSFLLVSERALPRFFHCEKVAYYY